MVIQFENFIQFLFFTSDAWDYLNGNVFLRYKGIILCVYINIILKIGFRRVFRRYMRKIYFSLTLISHLRNKAYVIMYKK